MKKITLPIAIKVTDAQGKAREGITVQAWSKKQKKLGEGKYILIPIPSQSINN